MKKKSIGINAIVNGVKTLLSIAFPLITYPYISRILQVENLGKYNFSYSIIDYFYLFSALGIATYAVREGAKYRNSRKEISRFASEVFTINVFSTVISYIALFALLASSGKLQAYKTIIIVLSISMVFTTVGCEWVYTIYEEYLYIALRTLAFQLLSLILLFVLVRSKDDVIKYAFIIVISNSGANLINLLGLKKYCKIRVCFSKNILIHLVPILILFANSIATRIYVNSDITILGLLTNDYKVGIYTIASKIYSITKQVLSAVIIVSIPRLSLLWAEHKKKEYDELANRILYMLVTLVIPATVGLFALSKQIVLLISTKEFISAYIPLGILSGALFFCLFNWFFTSCVLIPAKREKKVLLATISSAAINVMLNFILIPYIEESAAALTTLIAEACSLLICVWNSRDIISIKFNLRDICSTALGSIYILIICSVVKNNINNSLLCIVVSIVVSVVGYAAILFLMKNNSVMYVYHAVKTRIKNK